MKDMNSTEPIFANYKPFIVDNTIQVNSVTVLKINEIVPDNDIIKSSVSRYGLDAIADSDNDIFYMNFNMFSKFCFQAYEFDKAVEVQCEMAKSIINNNINSKINGIYGYIRL